MEALRFQIFLWLLNYWRMYRPERFDMADAWREICESMPLIPVCANEGCDTILFGYAPHAIWCSGYCREQSPERRTYLKDWWEANPEYMKDWCEANPEQWKAIRKKYREKNKEHIHAYDKDYRARKKAERLAAEEQTSP